MTRPGITVCTIQYLIDHCADTDTVIAKHCNLSRRTIADLRGELGLDRHSDRCKVTVCHVQYVLDNRHKSAARLAQALGLSDTRIKRLKNELGIAHNTERAKDIYCDDVTPWQLARQAGHDVRRTAELLERYGYERWSMRDVAWLCSKEGRLHG